MSRSNSCPYLLCLSIAGPAAIMSSAETKQICWKAHTLLLTSPNLFEPGRLTALSPLLFTTLCASGSRSGAALLES